MTEANYTPGLPAATYADPAIFDQEMERIFGRVWIFVGHESQIPKAGDFRRTKIGLRDVLVVRQGEGGIRVISNVCTHRGTRLCVTTGGNVRSFVCPYHAWTFDLDGSLQRIPDYKDFPPSVSLNDPQLSLLAAPRVDSYRGFIFASLAEEGPSLPEFLGEMTNALDNLTDRAPDGEIFADGGHTRVRIRGNWKLHHENANDTVHPGFVHQSSVNAARKFSNAADAMDGGQSREMFLANGYTPEDWHGIELTGLPQGHSFMGGFYRAGPLAPQSEDDVTRRYRTALEAAHGKKSASDILGLDRFNNLIWPNLSVNAQYHVVRFVHPVSVNESIIEAMCFRLGGAPIEIFHRAIRFMTNLTSPASVIFSDDFSVFERAQAGMEQGVIDVLESSRGLATDVVDSPTGKARSTTSSELPNRVQASAWRYWMNVGP